MVYFTMNGAAEPKKSLEEKPAFALLFKKREVGTSARNHARKKLPDDRSSAVPPSPNKPSPMKQGLAATLEKQLDDLALNVKPAALSDPCVDELDAASDNEELKNAAGPTSDEEAQTKLSAAFQEYFASCIEARHEGQPALEVQFRGENKGRGIVALRDLSKFELLWKEEALVALPFEEKSLEMCGYCFKSIDPERCLGCYCNKDCERNDLFLFQYEKKYVEKKPYPNVVRLLARVLRLKQKGDVRATLLPELATGPVDHEWAEKMANAVFQMRDLVADGNFVSPSEALHFMSTLQTNGMTIGHMEDFAGRADGLFVATALANHSCEPNAVTLFHERGIYVYALRDIRKGDEVCINYIDVCEPEWRRREELGSRFHFTCRCQLCIKERSNMQPGHETKQRKLFSAISQVERFKDYEKFESDPDVDRRLLQETRKRMSLKLTCKETVDYTRVIKIASRIVDTYSKYLGPSHPLTLFFEMGLLRSTVFSLNERPKSRQECREFAIEGQKLVRRIETWRTQMLQWVPCPSDLDPYEMHTCLNSVLEYSRWMELHSRWEMGR